MDMGRTLDVGHGLGQFTLASLPNVGPAKKHYYTWCMACAWDHNRDEFARLVAWQRDVRGARAHTGRGHEHVGRGHEHVRRGHEHVLTRLPLTARGRRI